MRIEHLTFPLRLIMHPFGGFWDLKYEGKGKLAAALTLVLLLAVTFIVKRQYAGFIVNMNNPDTLNSLDELKFVVLPFLIWCVANWSLTTLMDGEGTFREIVMATGYALVPFILIYIPQTFLSRIMTEEESVLYAFLNGAATCWFLWLLFVGTMTVHQYSVTKTLVTMALTLVVIGIILFLGLLFFSLIQQIVAFVFTLYQEMQFRM